MTARRVSAFLLAFGLAIGFTLVVTPVGDAQVASPVTIVESGWWSLRPGAPLPQGAFQVAQNPNGTGDMTVAAVKFRVSAKKLSSALFVMGEASSPLNFRNDTAGILACRSNSDWPPANPGLLANAPTRDCSKTIQMVRSATLASWSADLLPLLDGKTGLVSIMFVPGAPAAGSLPITSIEDLPVQLPSLPIPAVGGVPIPPPLPAPLEYPELPASIAFPLDLGYTVEFSNIQMSAAIPDPGGSLTTGATPSIGDIGSDGFGFSLDASPPLTGGVADTASTPLQTGAADVATRAPALASNSGPGKPWGRAWGLLVLAVLIGVGGTVAKRFAAWGAG